MSCSPDLETRKREISVMVDEVNALEQSLQLPEVDGLDDYDRLEVLDIINRIERRMLARTEAAE